MPTSAQVAIVGGGPIGLALAAMLVAHGVHPNKVVLIDGRSLDQASADPRSIALSLGSHQLLSTVSAWPNVATPITQIHVSRRGSLGRTLIDAADYQLAALGYVCRYGDLVAALDAAMPGGMGVCRSVTVEHLETRAHDVKLNLSNGGELTAPIIVQAEGGVFGAQTRKAQYRDYAQVALTATVHASAPPAGRAFERFTTEGPLALLPLGDGYAMVWCVAPATAEHLMAMDEAIFLRELQRVFGHRVGTFSRLGRRHHYPLGLNAAPTTEARCVAIGNAAQTLHPVAGQGLNLGLRDAAVLATLLARDPSATTLTKFVRERQRDRATTIGLTDLMARAFTTSKDQSALQRLLGASLGLLDLIPPAKRTLAEQMMYGWR